MVGLRGPARQLEPVNEEYLKGFKKDCQIRKITTFEHYAMTVARFMRWLEDQRISPLKVGTKELKDYLYHLSIEKGLIPKTVARDFAGLNAFYGYLEEGEFIERNPIPQFKWRNVRSRKANSGSQERKIISAEDAARLVGSVLETQDRAIILMLLKTGIRNHELCDLDVIDIDLPALTVNVKPTPKRSNCKLYFDLECAEAIKRWLDVRSTRKGARKSYLFLTTRGNRITKFQVQRLVAKHAARVKLHNPESKRLEDRFTPHCCRHFFTTCLVQSGMPREFIKELRGDSRHEAIDIYNHIDEKKLQESYLRHIPKLGI